MTVTRVLVAGDRFIRPSIFRNALAESVGDRITVSELELPWPDEPFGAVGEVDEASGDEEEMIAALQGAAVAVSQLAPMTERVLEASPDLKLIAVSRGGPTNVNLEAARRLGVQVTNVPGRNGVATAEMTLGLALALLRRIPLAHDSLLHRRWRGDMYRSDQVGVEAAGSTIGLVGAGAVGMHVSRVFHAMGAEVLVFDPYLPSEALDGVATKVETVEELFERSSLVSIHARLTAETAGMVDQRLLSLMPPGALLVNAARGGLVDYDAVVDALEFGHLRGAAFDVYPDEPANFDHRLFDLARSGYDVVLTPHIAGASWETAQRAACGAAEEVRRFLDGEPALNPLVDPELVGTARQEQP